MDELTRNILMILLEQQIKTNEQLAEIQRRFVEERETTNMITCSAGELILAAAQLKDKEQRKGAIALMESHMKSVYGGGKLSLEASKLESANERTEAYLRELINGLKHLQFDDDSL